VRGFRPLVLAGFGLVASVAIALSVAVPADAIPGPIPPSPPVEQTSSRPATDVPPLTSKPLTAYLGEPQSTTRLKNDAVDTSLPATPTREAVGGFDPSKATLTGRTELTDEYVDSSGQQWTVASAQPKNVLNAEGQWVPMSTTIGAIAGGAAKASLHPLSPVFASTADSSKLLQVSRQGHTATMSLDGAKAAPLQLSKSSNSELSYANALPGADLRYQVRGVSVSEQLVLAAAPQSAPVYDWHLSAPGLTVQVNKFGDHDLVDASGTVIFSIPQPIMWLSVRPRL